MRCLRGETRSGFSSGRSLAWRTRLSRVSPYSNEARSGTTSSSSIKLAEATPKVLPYEICIAVEEGQDRQGLGLSV